ncbi:hypothetical protein CWC05_03605 [Pseudoalteromonas ruthenica]|uniref:Uncharacterized protein n=1 Tax=Pseudoalteromonas ruthenica TaxID=151081 RepID=A0A5S3Z8J1_9GAMM|nr:phage holin family protein [Pseudoalteromonas ruthenica]MCG7567083.1 phage holin family protein [Pseudoalteromonas sp. CnMc7-15]MCG7570538.1 phage holin family protein [Pseudoalteromonas sp. CNC9-20]TLX52043.1 hypothetical protein CWC31_02520 [Pseudoalteromonas ruthenica]TMP88528.1 hypothetical protein CWC05_03605 [Pseudoalteromonas ruthenica]
MSWIDIVAFIKQWGRLGFICLAAAAIQMYLSGKRFTYFHYFMSVLIAIFAAYLAASFCDWRGFDENLKTGVIGVTAYAAPHILEGFDKLVKLFSKDPHSFFKLFARAK